MINIENNRSWIPKIKVKDMKKTKDIALYLEYDKKKNNEKKFYVDFKHTINKSLKQNVL